MCSCPSSLAGGEGLAGEGGVEGHRSLAQCRAAPPGGAAVCLQHINTHSIQPPVLLTLTWIAKPALAAACRHSLISQPPARLRFWDLWTTVDISARSFQLVQDVTLYKC